MNTTEIFRLAVRLLGLVFLYRGLETFPTATIHFIKAFFAGEMAEVLNSLIVGAWPLAVAYWLLAGAPGLFNRIFPASPNDPKA